MLNRRSLANSARYLGIAFALLVPALLPAQSVDYANAHFDRRLAMKKTSEKIAIDGALDEKAWQDSPIAKDFVQQEPREGIPMTFPTEVKILYDNENLYLGVIAYDPDARHVVVND